MPPIPGHLIWYILGWMALMSPFYILGLVLYIFLIDARRFMFWFMEKKHDGFDGKVVLWKKDDDVFLVKESDIERVVKQTDQVVVKLGPRFHNAWYNISLDCYSELKNRVDINLE